MDDAPPPDAKRLCLNMIVKNETANLQRCLDAIAPHIACWVIGDTGSTDGTQDFIRGYFAERGIPGELHSFPFINFEQARNAALDHAYASPLTYDYLLFDDADMELVVDDPAFRTRLEAPGHQVIQKAGSGLVYWNTRLVRREIGARYRGVTHEYLDVPGGTQRLNGVWYKDHASGSNRTDKFDRDARLLTEALEEDPDNHRTWFYLAQSYRDGGKTKEAAEAYAKRATMGGWDEEAWNARLQEARCLRTLGDDAGFLRAALQAFNQRPSRAEPLYDLARYYRERGMNDASVLFSEPGLAIPRPDQDALFIEDFVYTSGLLEEYAIAANYSRDPARKERGHAACDWLALSRDTPAGTRNLARSNLFFYAEQLSAMAPSFAAKRIAFDPPEGWRALNPSIARWGDHFVAVLRTVNYELRDDGGYVTFDGSPTTTRNYLLRLNDALEIESSAEILPPADWPPPQYPLVRGFEDLRLFVWHDALWCNATVREHSPEGWCEQVLARIDCPPIGPCHLTDWRVLRPEGERLHEKNWMPLVDGDALRFIYLCDPTRVVDDTARTVGQTVPPIAADEFKGGSQAIAFDGGWLALIHEVIEQGGKRRYQHRFVWFDAESTLRKVSRRFYFAQSGIEFAAGLAWHPDGRLTISYGTSDSTASVATADMRHIQRLLVDIRDSARLGLASINHRVPSKRSPSNWFPPRPLAGTEIMVETLRRRLGPELERINLQINSLGRDDRGARPLVVWFHHDVNQASVQWCKDRALTQRIDCSVFVSDWQRERYINIFGLPRERCVVLRNATEVSANIRQWNRGIVWRCAYTSTPFRGLSTLLKAWELLDPIDAELHIWSSMKLYRLGRHDEDKAYQHLYDKAQSLPGVIYHGLSPNTELRAALRDIHFFTYPSTFEETSCLAVIEAMAAGCRVIAPWFGALPETTAGYGRLYPWVADENAHASAFAHVLASEMAEPWNGDPSHAEAQQHHCGMIYDWSHRDHEWRRLIREVCANTSRTIRAIGA